MPFAGRVWQATSPDANFLTACSLGTVGSRSQLGLGHPALARGTRFTAGEHNQPVGGWEAGSQPCGAVLSSVHPGVQCGLGRLLKKGSSECKWLHRSKQKRNKNTCLCMHAWPLCPIFDISRKVRVTNRFGRRVICDHLCTKYP